MKIVFFRHGETDANKMGICQARGNFALNSKGIKQANILKEKLKDVKFSAIISSPLDRAYQTALIVAENRNINITKNENLIEINNDTVEGMTYDEFFEKYISIFGPIEDTTHPDFLTSCIPGGESRLDIINRWKNVLSYIKDKFNYNDTIGIASHYGFLKAVLFYYLNEDKDEIDNCEFFEIEI